MKNIHSPNWVGIGSWGLEIWPHEYLISPIEISEIGLVPNSYEPGQFTLISMGLIRYSCSHILGHHESIHVKFGVWGFFIMFYWNIKILVMKMLKWQKKNTKTKTKTKKKKKIWWHHTSVGLLYRAISKIIEPILLKHVCTHLNANFMLNSNDEMKMWMSNIFKKKIEKYYNLSSVLDNSIEFHTPPVEDLRNISWSVNSEQISSFGTSE